MNIQQEIEKHIEWIESIANMLGDTEFTQEDLHKISQHDQCELGKWLESKYCSLGPCQYVKNAARV